MPSTGRTFTAEESRKGAAASNAVQAQKRAETDARLLVAHEIVDEMTDLSPAMLRGALHLARLLDAGASDLPLDSWLDAQRASTVMETMHRIHRLASGQSTSNVAHANLSPEERAARTAQLEAMASDTPAADE